MSQRLAFRIGIERAIRCTNGPAFFWGKDQFGLGFLADDGVIRRDFIFIEGDMSQFYGTKEGVKLVPNDCKYLLTL